MSFKRKYYTLRFPEAHQFSGLVVSIKPISYEDLITVTSLQGTARESGGSDLAELEPLFEILSRAIIKWSLTEDDDTMAKTDPASLKREDFAMIMAIIDAWTKVVTGITPSLGKGSTSGAPFPEGSIPMETLSPSLLSSSTPS
jgi:hypothetical protein